MGDGGNINQPLQFDGTNYAYWNVFIRAFLISIYEQVSQSVEFGWKHPTETIPNVVTTKPRNKWTKEEIKFSSYNGKGSQQILYPGSPTDPPPI